MNWPTDSTPETVIERFGMQPIPEEGGWFAPGPRTQGLGAITVLLTDQQDGFSAMHRLRADEGWQWLAGAPAALLRLRPRSNGVLNYVDAGRNQFLVRKGTWMGAASLGAWTLFSCWCAPAFRTEHFELGDRDTLAAAYPSYTTEIAALTRDRPTGPGESPGGGEDDQQSGAESDTDGDAADAASAPRDARGAVAARRDAAGRFTASRRE
jgi:uncharacterized protein